MKHYYFIGFFWVLCGPLFAIHGGSIKGLITETGNNAELSGISVSIAALSRSTVTNELGVFYFNDLPEGNYILKISGLGYETEEKTVQVTDHESTVVKIILKPAQLALSEIQVSAHSAVAQQSISQLDMFTRPMNSAQDVLRIVPGLFIAQHAGGGKAEQIFLRGFDIDHGTDIKIEADGMPVNMVSHAHGQGYADLHFVIPELIERVDFQKGPYTSSVGNLATAGHVKFETASVLRSNFVTLEAGQFDSYRTVAGINLLGERLAAQGTHAYIANESMFSNGYFDAPQNFKRFNWLGKFKTNFDESQTLSITLSRFSSNWLASGQVPDRAVSQGRIGFFGAIDPTEGGQTSRSNLNVQHMKVLNSRTLIKNQVFLSDYDFELYSNFTFFLEDSLNGDQIRQKESRKLSGYNGAIQHETQLGGQPLQLEGGVQIRYDATLNTELSRTKARILTLERLKLGNVEELNAAIYADARWQLSPRWGIQAGLRYDQFHFDYHDKLDTTQNAFSAAAQGILSPKLNVFWDALPNLQLFVQAGRGFHSNDARVVASQTGRAILPAATGFDLGFKAKPLPRLVLTGSVWQLHLQQEFVYVGDAGIVEPSGASLRRGVDLSARWQILSSLYADIDLNFTRPRSIEEPEGAQFIPLAPTRSSIGGLRFERKGWMANLRYRYLADRAANEDNSLVATGYGLLDAVLSFSPTNKKGQKPFELTLSAQNLSNQRWKEAQFETESRLANETDSVTEIHFTPGTPLFVKAAVSFRF